MTTFLKVRDAARLVGKSPSSIRRIIHPIIADDQHPDRTHVQPGAEEALALRLKGENFAWRISEELLRREVPQPNPDEIPVETPDLRAAQDNNIELLTILRRELDIKNQQITQQSEMLTKQMELINGLSERLREGNVLIGSLQQRLALNDGSVRLKATTVETRPAKPGAAQPSTKITPQKPAPKAPKPKRGFFRFFR